SSQCSTSSPQPCLSSLSLSCPCSPLFSGEERDRGRGRERVEERGRERRRDVNSLLFAGLAYRLARACRSHQSVHLLPPSAAPTAHLRLAFGRGVVLFSSGAEMGRREQLRSLSSPGT